MLGQQKTGSTVSNEHRISPRTYDVLAISVPASLKEKFSLFSGAYLKWQFSMRSSRKNIFPFRKIFLSNRFDRSSSSSGTAWLRDLPDVHQRADKLGILINNEN
jgi:hypothetical protein